MRPASQSIQLQIEKLLYGGSGLAHSDGTAVFVPFTLRHETVAAQVTKEHDSFVEAELEGVVSPSGDRVTPRCAHFGACGGCQYQHASYEAQLRIKEEILQETLTRAGLHVLPEIEVHAEQPWQYRNRIRLRVAEIDGALRVGYLRRSSSTFLPIHMCPIAAPVLWRAAETLLTLNGDASRWLRYAEEIELFTTPDERSLQMTFFVRTEPKGFAEFCAALKDKLPELVGGGVAVINNVGRGRKSLRPRAGSNWGAQGVNYEVSGERYWVSRGGFFQVNRYMIGSLLEIVTKQRSGYLAWDLYAGVGLFSRALAKHFAEVVAVEAAAHDLARSFHGKGRRTVAATTVEFLRQAVIERERPDLVVADPPRAGLGPDVCDLLIRMGPKEIVYVSCDPTTLGRDLRAMVDSGYRLHELHMVDMFPQTFHQETVAVLKR